MTRQRKKINDQVPSNQQTLKDDYWHSAPNGRLPVKRSGRLEDVPVMTTRRTILNKIPITPQGYENLQKELHTLKTIERPQVIKAIEEARAHGDLSENAEYDAAKERQAFIESRVNELSFKLSNADIIDAENLPKDRAVFACRVLLENAETGEDVQYQLVGPDESDISKGLISISSPLGRAIIGRKPGDEIVLQAPGGKRIYELVDIL
jgi:transcription elongation factor GreA